MKSSRCQCCGRQVEKTDLVCFDLLSSMHGRVCWNLCPSCKKEIGKKNRSFPSGFSVGRKSTFNIKKLNIH